MAIVHYKGNLGEFDYDDTLFLVVEKRAIHYIGNETDGAKIHIPEGITDCFIMFYRSDIETPPVIPESVVNCDGMFRDCKNLISAPVIPESVVNCQSMFQGCTSLKDAPVIPEGVKECDGMFGGCECLKTAPKIPEGVEDCGIMFKGCVSLEKAPVIPEGVKECRSMFADCTNLKEAPVIPESVRSWYYMFEGCSEEVQKQGKWNIGHRGLAASKEVVVENENFIELRPEFKSAQLSEWDGKLVKSKLSPELKEKYKTEKMWLELGRVVKKDAQPIEMHPTLTNIKLCEYYTIEQTEKTNEEMCSNCSWRKNRYCIVMGDYVSANKHCSEWTSE